MDEPRLSALAALIQRQNRPQAPGAYGYEEVSTYEVEALLTAMLESPAEPVEILAVRIGFLVPLIGTEMYVIHKEDGRRGWVEERNASRHGDDFEDELEILFEDGERERVDLSAVVIDPDQSEKEA